MTIETYNYDQPVSGCEPVENIDITIAEGENVAELTPLVRNTETGEFKAAVATDTAAQFLSSFAVDATDGAKKHRAIKAGTFDPDFIAWPEDMTEAVKAILFAGTPIGVQSPREI